MDCLTPGGQYGNKDPFSSLPWFVLLEVLSLLPDLPTLHRLCDAFPAVASFLSHTKGVFSQVVERIMTHPDCDRGLDRKVQFYLRLFVLIWWRTSSIKSDHHDTDVTNGNPLPSSFTEVAYFVGQTALGSRVRPDRFGDEPLPRLTPYEVLYRLLRFSTKLRQLTHACFHDLVANCMALRPERMENPNSPFPMSALSASNRSNRPKGIPFTPRDIGPPSCLEEQRLMQTILQYWVFWELKDATMTNDILKIAPDDPAIEFFRSDQVEAFWYARPLEESQPLRGQQREQFRVVLAWFTQQERGQLGQFRTAWSSSLSPKWIYCCAVPKSLTAKQRLLPETRWMSFAPGYAWGKLMVYGPWSPIRKIDLAVFRPFGFNFWDEDRLIALGFMVPLEGKGQFPTSYSDRKDLTFRWSSILTEDQWNDYLQRLQRCQT